MDVGLSRDLVVKVGLGQRIGVGVGNGRIVDASCVKASVGGHSGSQRLTGIGETSGGGSIA